MFTREVLETQTPPKFVNAHAQLGNGSLQKIYRAGNIFLLWLYNNHYILAAITCNNVGNFIYLKRYLVFININKYNDQMIEAEIEAQIE